MTFELFEEEKQTALQAELDKIGAVLEFQVFQIPQNFSGENIDENITENLHRQFLAQYFKPYDESIEDYANRLPYQKWLENYPEISDIEKAIPQCLDNSAIKPIEINEVLEISYSPIKFWQSTTWFELLCEQFCKPPYGLSKLYKKEKENFEIYQLVWDEFCEVVGLNPSDNQQIQVIDWVGYGLPEKEIRKRANWSSYFVAGLEWWGVWCLTIYNPIKNTLAVVTASTSD